MSQDGSKLRADYIARVMSSAPKSATAPCPPPLEESKKPTIASGIKFPIKMLPPVIPKSADEATKQEDVKVCATFEHPSSEGFSLNEIEVESKKKGDDLRRGLLQKLCNMKILIPPSMKVKTHQTVIIFDWDDTLLCTSYLNPAGIVEAEPVLTEVTKAHLKELEPAVYEVLEMAITSGQTYIITNAAPGWVQYSAGVYYPSILELLKKVKIISARGDWETKFPGNYEQWKVHAFLNTVNHLVPEAITNIVALGDSHVEMVAAHHLASKFDNAFIKTVKFRENPTPQELVKQLNLVKQKFTQICGNVKSLTIRLERKTPALPKKGP